MKQSPLQQEPTSSDTWTSFCDFPEISHITITGANVSIIKQDNFSMVRAPASHLLSVGPQTYLDIHTRSSVFCANPPLKTVHDLCENLSQVCGSQVRFVCVWSCILLYDVWKRSIWPQNVCRWCFLRMICLYVCVCRRFKWIPALRLCLSSPCWMGTSGLLQTHTTTCVTRWLHPE